MSQVQTHLSRSDAARADALLCLQAGTYIKEFVHGDEGRTQPNVSSLVGASEASKCLTLDVEQIHMDWP